jgi:hypothetical protein
MRGTVSFHPVDLSFFDETIQPLLGGGKINPESYVATAERLRQTWVESRRYVDALERLLDELEPPPPPEEGPLWGRIRARLERFDYRPTEASVRVAESVDPELHFHGRPFLITEGSADRVAVFVEEYRSAGDAAAVEALALEQIVHLDPELGRQVEPDDPTPESGIPYRTELLNGLRAVYDLGRAAETDGAWAGDDGARQPARDALPFELPWRAVTLHSRAVPFWIGREVDGLVTICAAAGIEVPDFVAPAWRLFGDAADRFPGLREALGVELRREREVGAFIAPDDIEALLTFLGDEGARIIQVATRHGEGPTCSTLLRKIRECARYAGNHGMGYLEAIGVPPVVPEPERMAVV